jgi:signal transduction histidine kinase
LNLNRQLEETAVLAQTANRAKSTFLSTMSHEIRTPMNAILGFAQLLLRDPELGPDAIANVEIICRSGEHLPALINDVLDMSKIEAGHSHLNPVVFNLSRFFDDLVETLRIRAEAKALRLGMSFDRQSVTYVMADEGKLRQALSNLIGNAIKFTQRGRITLHIAVDPKTGDGLWLVVRIEDTGSGIADEDLEKLFEPFSQGKGELNTQEELAWGSRSLVSMCA